jgi:hypothetical protein
MGIPPGYISRASSLAIWANRGLNSARIASASLPIFLAPVQVEKQLDPKPGIRVREVTTNHLAVQTMSCALAASKAVARIDESAPGA